jgi:hypothetical protein
MANRHSPARDTTAVKVWRLELRSSRFQLQGYGKRIAKLGRLSGEKEEVSTKTIIYLAFRPPKNFIHPVLGKLPAHACDT